MSDYVTLTLEEAFKDVLAHLAAAHSLLEHSPKTGAPSNKMFDMMLADYAASIERGRKSFAAHLSRAAEPVGFTGAMPGTNGGFTQASFRASEVPVGTKLYTHPSEDTQDTERLEWLVEAMQMADLNRILGCCPMQLSDLRAAIDAAMAKENGNGK